MSNSDVDSRIADSISLFFLDWQSCYVNKENPFTSNLHCKSSQKRDRFTKITWINDLFLRNVSSPRQSEYRHSRIFPVRKLQPASSHTSQIPFACRHRRSVPHIIASYEFLRPAYYYMHTLHRESFRQKVRAIFDRPKNTAAALPNNPLIWS